MGLFIHSIAPFAALFPNSVGAAEICAAHTDFPLFPEEAEAVRHAVGKRRAEFSAGRHCARLAMAALGHPPCGIARGPDRVPIWPPGLVGSITHGDGVCAAVVAPEHRYRSIGIDMELIDAVPDRLLGEIQRSDETHQFDDVSGLNGADWPTLLFCLKEAAFKAFYPRHRRVIDFQEMYVHVSLERHEFIAEVPGLGGTTSPMFQGRYLVRHGRVHAAAWGAEG